GVRALPDPSRAPPPLSPVASLFNATSATALYPLSLHDALPISVAGRFLGRRQDGDQYGARQEPRRRLLSAATRSGRYGSPRYARSEEHTSELQSRENLVCRLLLEKKNHDRCRSRTSSATRHAAR